VSVGTIARRYAKALLELADEQNAVDKVQRDLLELVQNWEASRELREVFENPAVSSEARRKVIEGLANRMGMSVLLKNTLMLFSDRRRMRHVPDLAEAFQTLAEAKSGKVRAEVVSARGLSETYYTQLREALESVTGRKVVLVKRQDPSLIGGVVTRVGDQVFDGSIKTRLDELKDELLNR
jgi:F-type H+-transporting ATPase subunit delta